MSIQELIEILQVYNKSDVVVKGWHKDEGIMHIEDADFIPENDELIINFE